VLANLLRRCALTALGLSTNNHSGGVLVVTDDDRRASLDRAALLKIQNRRCATRAASPEIRVSPLLVYEKHPAKCVGRKSRRQSVLALQNAPRQMNGSGKASSRSITEREGKKETMKQFTALSFQFSARSFEYSHSTRLLLKTENRKL
jgi:hypothetical protein